MSMDKDTVRKVASLARIRVTEDDLDKLTPQVGGILTWVEQLGEVNTDNVEPLANVVDIAPHQRRDEINDGACQDKVLANAPEDLEGYYVVPKVVE